MTNYAEDYQKKLLADAEVVMETSFWQEFAKLVLEARRNYSSALEKDALELLPEIRGKIRGLDFVLLLPGKILDRPGKYMFVNGPEEQLNG